MRGNLALTKVGELLWRTTIPLYKQGAEIDARFLESMYPNAEVYTDRYDGAFHGRDAAIPHHVYLKFADAADEAEFILREKA